MPERSEILKKNKPTRGEFTDGIPRVAIRFDDGDQAQIPDISQYLKAGLPVSMALNFQGVLDAPALNDTNPAKHKMTARDVLNLKAQANRFGTRLSVMSHGNLDFADADNQDLTAYEYSFNQFNPIIQSNKAPHAIGWPLDAPKDPATGNFMYDFRRLNGGDIKSFVVPGTHEDWIRARSSMIRKAMQDLGLQYGSRIGIAMSGSVGAGGTAPVDGQAYGYYSAGLGSNLNNPDYAATPQYSDGIRPGMVTDPYSIPNSAITDLGQTVVTRNAFMGDRSDGYTSTEGVKWLLGDNNSGEDLGDGNLDWELTYQYKYCRNLAMGMSWIQTSHGDVRSNGGTAWNGDVFNGVNVNFAGGSSTSANHYSSRHIAWVLRKLQDANLIRVVTIDEWNQWMYSDPAIGLDYVPNNMFVIPDIEIGDNIQADCHTPAFVCSRAIGATSWDNQTSFWNTQPPDTSGNQHWDDAPFEIEKFYDRDRTADDQRDTAAATGVLFTGGDGVMAHPGWVKLRADAGDPAQAVMNQGIFSWIGLIPGRYKFSCLLSSISTGNLVLQDVSMCGYRSRNDFVGHIDDPESNQGFKEYAVINSDLAGTSWSLSSNHVVDIALDFVLPNNPLPTTTSRVDVDIPNIPAGTESSAFALDDPLIGASANVGMRAIADANNWDPSLYQLKAAVTAKDAAEASIINDDGSDYNPSTSGIYYVQAYKDQMQWNLTQGGPDVPWSYTMALTFDRTSLSEVVLSRPSFEYLGQAK